MANTDRTEVVEYDKHGQPNRRYRSKSKPEYYVTLYENRGYDLWRSTNTVVTMSNGKYRVTIEKLVP
jgi:hypothetical protein